VKGKICTRVTLSWSLAGDYHAIASGFEMFFDSSLPVAEQEGILTDFCGLVYDGTLEAVSERALKTCLHALDEASSRPFQHLCGL
jgi:hypothetical protein